MAPIDADAIATVFRKLAPLQERHILVGGAAVPLLIDDLAIQEVRPTKDVDVVVQVTTRIGYSNLEQKLRELGFRHDVSEGAPRCRWVVGDGVLVDVMPAHDPSGQWSGRWFGLAMDTAELRRIGDMDVRVINASCFLATKIEAFKDRGGEDYYGSHDLEDLIAVVDGRSSLREEMASAPDALRNFVVQGLRGLLADRRFLEALPGHLPGDPASQMRRPILLRRLREVAGLM